VWAAVWAAKRGAVARRLYAVNVIAAVPYGLCWCCVCELQLQCSAVRSSACSRVGEAPRIAVTSLRTLTFAIGAIGEAHADLIPTV
jgi:hypothetical protein